MSDMQATHADYMKVIRRLEANNATGRGLQDGLRAIIAKLESELTTANAAIQDRDDRLAEIALSLRVSVNSDDPALIYRTIHEAIALAERTEAGHE